MGNQIELRKHNNGIDSMDAERNPKQQTVNAVWLPAILVHLTDNSIFRYLQNAKIISERYRDQPMTPTDTMVYWSEYVIRHKGAPHLRSAGLDLNYFQYHNIDAFAAIIASFVISYYALKCIICRLCCRKSKEEKRTNKKKNN